MQIHVLFGHTIMLWDAIEDSKFYGSKQWWFPRYQGRFNDYYLSSN